MAWSAEPQVFSSLPLQPLSPGIAFGVQNVFISFLCSHMIWGSGCRRVPEYSKARHVISSHFELGSNPLRSSKQKPYHTVHPSYPRRRLKKQIKNFLVPNTTLGTCNKGTYNRDARSTGAIRTRRQHSRQVFLFAAGRPRGVGMNLMVCVLGSRCYRCLVWTESRCVFARTRANTEGVSFIVSGSAL